MKYSDIVVLMGGWVAERDVSLSSGNACADALETLGYNVKRLDVDRNVAATLLDLKPDAVFNALHGPFGEDGCIQGILELMKIPYTHSGVLASALAMNKEKAKAVFFAAGVPTAEHNILAIDDIGDSHPVPPPYVLKPIEEGSSFGVLIVDREQPFPSSEVAEIKQKYGDTIMVEKFIPGRELTCAVMGNKVLDIIEIIPNNEKFYNFQAKYEQGGSKHIIPAEISSEIYDTVQDYAMKAHISLGCKGITRSDFRYNDSIEGVSGLFCLEVNTQPGMTPTSLVPEMAEHSGYNFSELVHWILEDASCQR